MMRPAGAVAIAAMLLLWPALINGYPLVFSDTGTYLSQAIHHYLGWDRPVFYSLFLLPLHMELTTWPAIVVQALITAHMLHLLRPCCGRSVTMLANGAGQLALFSTGDGLQPWPASVTPWIGRDFPAFERAEYERARQTEGRRLLPDWMPGLHEAASLAGLAWLLAVLPGAVRRRQPIAGFAAALLLGLLGNVLITGGLSGPHDRYQSRIMWLPLAIALLAAPLFLAERKRLAAPSAARPVRSVMPELSFAGSR